MPPRIQILSDLHLEVRNQYSSFQIPAAAPFLILAGDIGQLSDYRGYLQFLSNQCRQFERVYLVLGNHEFYGVSRHEGLKLAASLEQEPEVRGKLSILNRTRVELPGFPNITLLGCTLQSRIPPESVEAVSGRVKDFHRIKDWSIEDHNAEHREDVEWLRDQITSLRDGDRASNLEGQRSIIVITHHAPCINESSRPEHVQNPWTCSFATELLDQAVSPANAIFSQVQHWVFGHTHYTTSFIKAGVRLVSNQRGYTVKPKDESSNWMKLFRSSLHEFNVRKTITP
ncbi:Ser/Thr protein phosphatase superfamily protein [Arthroderma uncinatum]|uniref:Ser/Thr protein phosphatase superfamily protein n=1 Tax=Arthroderma uncinatum TaxID=74035 RepID=UPI00144AA079|nr:Ser/Thr protein phosphatase superfamily protein [Arthroderma uncinatum]KAF3481125.1 Ser/Thr protein phosphatase superfamily protein [Arthroderma uncinatum]